MRNKLTQDQPTLFIDQYGSKVVASSLAELRKRCDRGRVSKMYTDKKKDGRRVWNGYVIGGQWFTAFRFVEVDAPF